MARKTVEAKKNTYKYADAPIWNAKGELKAGDNINGYFIESNTFETKYGPYTMYILLVDGKAVKITGQTDLKNKFANIPEMCHVWIEYTGLTETEHGAKKTYKVEFDDEDLYTDELPF